MTGNEIVKLAFDNLDAWIRQYEAEHPNEHKTTLELAEMFIDDKKTNERNKA